MDNMGDRIDDLERQFGIKGFENEWSPAERKERIRRLFWMAKEAEKMASDRISFIRNLAETHNLKFYGEAEIEEWYKSFLNRLRKEGEITDQDIAKWEE